MGYCFLEFENEGVAQNVLMTLNLKQWPGTDKLLKLNWASSSNKGSKEEFSIYVGDLSPEVNDNGLFKFFASALPSCKSAKIVSDHTGMSKGFGFVRFSSEEDSVKAISSYNLAGGLGRNRIRVCKAFPKQQQNSAMGVGGHMQQTDNLHQYTQQQQQEQWQQYHQQMEEYNQSLAQYQMQYNEATEIEPYDDGMTVEEINKEYMALDQEYDHLFDVCRWQYFDSVAASKPVEQPV